MTLDEAMKIQAIYEEFGIQLREEMRKAADVIDVERFYRVSEAYFFTCAFPGKLLIAFFRGGTMHPDPSIKMWGWKGLYTFYEIERDFLFTDGTMQN